jgi:RNA polymerase sigma factor (TIGR02999 family)
MSMDDVTQILNAVQEGDARAANDLLPIVYEELRRLARIKMANEAAGHTLQPTALVHEAWLRLVVPGQQNWQNRVHFFSAAAEAMRRILVEHARRKLSQKRGAGITPESLEEESLVLAAPADELLAVHEALEKLSLVDVQAAELVKLRYFIGMTMEEAAIAMGLSKRTAEGLWTYARAWLRQEIRTQMTS